MQAKNFATVSTNVGATEQSRTMYGGRHSAQQYESFAHPDEDVSVQSMNSQELHEMRQKDSDLMHYPMYYDNHGFSPVLNASDPLNARIDANCPNYYPANASGQIIHNNQWQNFRSNSLTSVSSSQTNYPYDWSRTHSHRHEGDVTPKSDIFARSRSTSYTSTATNASHSSFNNSRNSANSSYLPSHAYIGDSLSRGSSRHSAGHYDGVPQFDQHPNQYRPLPVQNNMFIQAPSHDSYNYRGYYNSPDMARSGRPVRHGDAPQEFQDHMYPHYPEAYPSSYGKDVNAPPYGPNHSPLHLHPQNYHVHPPYRGWLDTDNYESGYFYREIPYDPTPGSYIHSEKSGTDTSISSLCSRVSSLSLDSNREFGEEFFPPQALERRVQPHGFGREMSHSDQSIGSTLSRIASDVDIRDPHPNANPRSYYPHPGTPIPRPYSAAIDAQDIKNVPGKLRSATSSYPLDYAHSRINNVKGRVVTIARSQTGCKDLVSLLSSVDAVREGIAEAVLNEVAPLAQELSLDPNGNYVMQQLIKILPLDLRLVLLYCITGRIQRDELPHHLPTANFDTNSTTQDLKKLSNYNFDEPDDALLPPLVQLSLSNHGTHVVQSLVDFCTEPVERYSIMAPLRMKPISVGRLCRDSNGCHVIMRLLRIGEADSTWIISRIMEDLLMLSKQKHGAPIIMQAIDVATPNVRRMLMNAVIKSAKLLASDPCANFIISHVLSTGSKSEANSCVLALLGNIRSLSMKKYGSNVIERCLGAVKPGPQAGRNNSRNKNLPLEAVSNPISLINPSVIAQVLKELLGIDDAELEKNFTSDPAAPVPEQLKKDVAKEINLLLSSTYGNYVVDRIIDAVFIAGPIYVRIFEESITLLLPTIGNAPSSKGFLSRVSSRFPLIMEKNPAV